MPQQQNSPLGGTLDRTFFNTTLYRRIQTMWFEGLDRDASTAPMPLIKKWFGHGSPADRLIFDTVCREFEPVLQSIGPAAYPLQTGLSWEEERAAAGMVAEPFLREIYAEDSVEEQAATALALILLLDQIPRNVFRKNQAVIYNHYDRLSRALVYTVMSRTPRLDQHPRYRHRPCYRVWFVLPLMHSEHLQDHEELLQIGQEELGQLQGQGDEEVIKFFAVHLSADDKHYEQIRRFGRYPFRNKSLGRETTAEEQAFMESGGEGFGAGVEE